MASTQSKQDRDMHALSMDGTIASHTSVHAALQTCVADMCAVVNQRDITFVAHVSKRICPLSP